MRHSVAFECAKDAKKNNPNIYFHMEPGEHRPEVRKQWIYAMDVRHGCTSWIYAMDLDFRRVPCENIHSDHFSLHY